MRIFRPNVEDEKISNLEKSEDFLQKILMVEKFPAKSEMFPLSNFFEDSETLFMRACKFANFQTQWSKWKFLQ